MVCIADDPASRDWGVCYHQKPGAIHGARQGAEETGKNFQEIFDIREQEAKAVNLFSPKQPKWSGGFTAAAEDYNATNGEVKNTYTGLWCTSIRYGRKHGTAC